MPLEGLLELVETLRARIDAHGAALRGSEALTRYALIDPLLRELGWDTSNPDMVVPEYNSGNGRADYALFINGSPAMMVEAKKLSTPLRDQVLAQGINYCLMEGTDYFSVTDGQRWEIYETHRPVPIDEKRIVSWDLQGSSPAEICLKALALWKPSVQSGYVATGQAPVVLSPSVEMGTVPAPVTVAETTQPVPPPTQMSDEPGWTRLSDLSWVKGHPRPTEIRFPDNSQAKLTLWYLLPAETTRWLANNGMLDTPIPASKSGNLMVSTEPFHPNGSPITNPLAVNGWFISKHGSGRTMIRRTKRIIEHVGQDPAQFKVRFS